MTNIVAGQGESFESLLRRFSKKVQQDGILAEIRRRGHFEKPSVKRKRKEAAKKRKTARAFRRQQILMRLFANLTPLDFPVDYCGHRRGQALGFFNFPLISDV